MRGSASFLKGTGTEALHSEGREKGGFNSSNHQNPSASPMAPPAGFLLANEALPSQRATGSGGGFLRPGFRRRGKRFVLGGQKRQRRCPMTLNSRRGSASAVLQLSRQGRLAPGERLFPTKRFAPSQLKMSWRGMASFSEGSKGRSASPPKRVEGSASLLPRPGFLSQRDGNGGSALIRRGYLSRTKRFPPKERKNRSASVGRTRKRGKGFKAGSASLGAVEIFSGPV